ncbi:hypothetical protein BH23PLA1_BH23PLA1_02800 [soil metagenome]
MERRAIRTLAFYEKGEDNLAGEYRLSGMDLPRLQNLFGVDPDNPMYDVWPVDPAKAEVLIHFVDGTIDLGKYDYYVECHALPESGDRYTSSFRQA